MVSFVQSLTVPVRLSRLLGQGFFVGPDGKLSRPVPIEWPATPEEICKHLNVLVEIQLNRILAFVKPYIFSVLPPGTVQTQQTEAPPHIHTNISPPDSIIFILTDAAEIAFPFNALSEPTAVQNALLRLMTPTSNNKSPLYLISTPTDKTTVASEGSSIWSVTLKPWSDQLDELVLAGQYLDALALLDTLDEAAVPDKVYLPTYNTTSHILSPN